MWFVTDHFIQFYQGLPQNSTTAELVAKVYQLPNYLILGYIMKIVGKLRLKSLWPEKTFKLKISTRKGQSQQVW